MARGVRGFWCASMRNHSVVISISFVRKFMYVAYAQFTIYAIPFSMHAAHRHVCLIWLPKNSGEFAKIARRWQCRRRCRRRHRHNLIICMHKYCCLQHMCAALKKQFSIIIRNYEGVIIYDHAANSFAAYVFQETRRYKTHTHTHTTYQSSLAIMKMSCMSHLYCRCRCCLRWKLQSIIFSVFAPSTGRL